jgi:hypothetical protein
MCYGNARFVQHYNEHLAVYFISCDIQYGMLLGGTIKQFFH